MNSNAIRTLTDPDAGSHMVYPYTTDAQLCAAACIFAAAGLRKGEGVVLLMTSDHCGPIRQQLTTYGCNLPMLEATGELFCIDAESLMSQFMLDGDINEYRFLNIIGGIIETAEQSSAARTLRPVRVFGEMVNVLWGRSEQKTARIEELWNHIIAAHPVSLLCAYFVGGTRPAELPDCLLSPHSHAIA
jgi:hypothetical protein